MWSVSWGNPEVQFLKGSRYLEMKMESSHVVLIVFKLLKYYPYQYSFVNRLRLIDMLIQSFGVK